MGKNTQIIGYHAPHFSLLSERDVTLPLLNIIRYTNPSGEEKELRLIEEMSPNWRSLGQTADVGAAKLAGFQTKNMNVNKGCMQDVATAWINMLSKNVNEKLNRRERIGMSSSLSPSMSQSNCLLSFSSTQLRGGD